MNIDIIKVGKLETNCYILSIGNKCLIIDPGDEANKIINKIDKDVLGIIITHSHFDHVGALDELIDYYKINKYDLSNLSEGVKNIGEFTFNVIYTPGHLNDAISIYFEKDKIMFVGDFIFKDGIGRVDLEGANSKEMKNSIIKILNYDDNITLYPGHGEYTTLGNERDNLNYYLRVL